MDLFFKGFGLILSLDVFCFRFNILRSTMDADKGFFPLSPLAFLN